MTRKPPIFQGSLPALVAPFRGGALDEDAVVALAERQIAAGAGGLVANGTTGESAALAPSERKSIVRAVVETAKGRVPVMAGVGTHNPAKTLAHAREAADQGADAALVVTPYYVRPSQEGLRRYFLTVADASPLPIVLYDVPARAGREIGVAVQAELSRHPNVIGVKDATGDMGKASELRRLCAEGYALLSGDDPSALGFAAHGGAGCVSVSANVAPKTCAAMQRALAEGDFAQARALNAKLSALHGALFADASPAPTKYALAKLGLCDEEARLPIAPASDEARRAVDAALDILGEDA